MERFEFATPGRIVFGAGAAADLGTLAAGLPGVASGGRALVVTGQAVARVGGLIERLQAGGLAVSVFHVEHEPTTDLVQAGVRAAREAGCDRVIGIGGGSVLDAGKAIAALLTNPGDLLDYLEVIGRALPLAHAPLPYIAVPTTAGTGTEVTRNAVLLSPAHRVKVSLRSPLMLPRLAVIDPELTYSMPPAVTASTGLDALTQVIEPYVCNRPNPLTDAICREGMAHAARGLRPAFETGDQAAREDMCVASLCGGLALANARLGGVHGFAGVLGGMFPAPHGAVCARLLPFVMEANLRALQAREPDNPTLRRYDEVARILTGEPDETAAGGVAWVKALCKALAVPPLGQYGLAEADIPTVVDAAARASSMQGNPIRLTPDELAGILRETL